VGRPAPPHALGGPIDGDDLPDGDYESIYDTEALHARTVARLDALLRRLDEMNQGQRLLALAQRLERLLTRPQP
jgi:hypothetical protein